MGRGTKGAGIRTRSRLLGVALAIGLIGALAPTSPAGAMTDTYGTAVLTESNNGNKYRVIVTNTEPSKAQSTTTSSIATLTVGLRVDSESPEVTEQPTPQSSVVGQTSTFSVTASPATGYQWQNLVGSTWTDITGANSSTYTTGILEASNNNTLFRVIVTNAEPNLNPATTTSSEVRLTVGVPLEPGSRGLAWGWNEYGQVGDGTTADPLSPVQISEGANATGQWNALAGGFYSSCGIALDDTAYCWGANDAGELGNGQTYEQMPLSSSPVAVNNGANTGGKWKAIGAGGGGEWACGLGTDNKAYCWGANGSDKYLGTGNENPSLIPASVVNGDNANGTWMSLSLGYYHTCGVGTDSKAYCWGYASRGDGTLGTGADTLSSDQPVAVDNGANTGGTWKSVSSGYYGSCGIGGDNKAYCWGYGTDGQLGNGDEQGDNAYAPVAVSNGQNSNGTWKALAVGYYRACGIGGDDKVYCWGYEPTGSGSATAYEPELVDIPSASAVTSLTSATGDYASCAIAGNTIWCWGANDYGQLGDGTGVNAVTPVSVDVAGVLASGTPLNVVMGGYQTLLVARFDNPDPTPTPTPDNGGGSSTPEAPITPTPTSTPTAIESTPVVDPLDPIGTMKNPNIPAGGVPAGGSLLLVDGKPVTVTVTPNSQNDPTSLQIDGPGLKMSLQGRDDMNNPLGLTSQQALILQSEQTLRSRSLGLARKANVQPAAVSSGTGFKPNSVVKFYILPGTYLGELPTDASGKYEGRLPVTAGLPAGVHTLQANGYAPDGSVRSLSLGVLVKESATTVRTLRADTTVQFTPNSAVLTTSGKAALRALVKKTGKTPITVASLGFVQKSGTNANDQSLSTARAKAVGTYLRSLGVKGTYTVRGDGVGGPGAADRKVTVSVTYRK